MNRYKDIDKVLMIIHKLTKSVIEIKCFDIHGNIIYHIERDQDCTQIYPSVNILNTLLGKKLLYYLIDNNFKHFRDKDNNHLYLKN